MQIGLALLGIIGCPNMISNRLAYDKTHPSSLSSAWLLFTDWPILDEYASKIRDESQNQNVPCCMSVSYFVFDFRLAAWEFQILSSAFSSLPPSLPYMISLPPFLWLISLSLPSPRTISLSLSLIFRNWWFWFQFQQISNFFAVLESVLKSDIYDSNSDSNKKRNHINSYVYVVVRLGSERLRRDGQATCRDLFSCPVYYMVKLFFLVPPSV